MNYTQITKFEYKIVVHQSYAREYGIQQKFRKYVTHNFLVIGPPLTDHLHYYSSHHPGIILEIFTRLNPQVNHEVHIQEYIQY